jgi:hypothetical protein
MKGPERHCNIKRQLKSSPNVLRRSVEPAPENMRSQAAVRKLGVTALGQQTLHLTDMHRAYECFRLEIAAWLKPQAI